MEDVVDSLLVRVKGSKHGADTDGFKELMSKMANLFKKGKARHQIATAIKDLKEQVQDVAARHDRYKADGVFANLAAATRIHSSRDELIEKLCLTDASKQLKILSIVGFGGLGKTTLARAVYDELRSKFDCAAFVSVSRSADFKKVLGDLLLQLDEAKYTRLGGATLHERELIRILRESLTAKRYFVVVDDIWDVSAWKTIKYALVDGECGSRIITTTRHVNVSKECSSYKDDMDHNMKPLSDGDSERLFYNRIFPGDNMCSPEYQEVSLNILKKCAGVPLAIISLASYLSSSQHIRPISEWYVLLDSIGSGLTKEDTNLEEMRRILSFSYYDLPSHLKTCLLYLSTFPEDYKINRDRLIRRWIAEGFIQGENSFNLGVSYFNDLVNRSMIEPIFNYHGILVDCRVHDIMLDLICYLASEENFVTVINNIKVDMPSEKKVRRLSIQNVELTNTRLATSSISQVRSLTIFSPSVNQMLPLSRFEILRVLDLEGCSLEENGPLDLSCVGDLLHLRYLGLRDTKVRKIPVEIGKLLFLETLDLDGKHKDAEELPASVVQLRNLMFLYLNRGVTYLPVGYKNLTSLQELSRPHFTEDGDPGELRYLTEMRVLDFCLPSRYPQEKLLILLESLDKMQKLERLCIESNGGEYFANLGDWVHSSLQLRSLLLQGWYEMMPTRINSSSFPLLWALAIGVHHMRPKDIQILGTLPVLRFLHVQSDEDSSTEEDRATDMLFMLRADAFPCLVDCYLQNVLFAPYMFPRVVMPKVEYLKFSLLVSDIVRGGDWDLCIGNLPSLKVVLIKLYGEEKSSGRYSEAEVAIKRAAAAHPNRPTARCRSTS